MNKELSFVSALLSLSLLGCIKEEAPQLEQQQTKVSVSLATVQTKTYLDTEVVNGHRSVYWDEGDAINVNGSESVPLTAEQAGQRSADFTLYNCTVPFNVIYPASICEGYASADKPVENVPAGNAVLNIPAVQKYSPTSFGKGSAILYGYGKDEKTPVELKNLCGAVKVTLKEGAEILNRALLVSNSKSSPIAGRYALDPQSGKYTVLDGVLTVSLEIEEVSLADGARSFYFTIPQGSYPEGFTIRFYNKEGFPMECQWLKMPGAEADGVTVEGGRLYEFKAVEYVAGKKEIMTGEEWKLIAEKLNSKDLSWEDTYLDKTNTIRLGADIVLPEGTPRITGTFKYILDGQGFSITNNNATDALIKDLPKGGVIRDLILAGNLKYENLETSQIEVSSFVYTLSGGEIENCVNRMQFDVKARTVIFGSFARTITAGTMSGCVNEADMNIYMSVAENTAGAKSFGGGLVATCFSPTGVSLLENCENRGNVTVTMKVDEDGKGGVGRAGFAGVLGYVSGATSEKYPKLINCTNSGQVKLLSEGAAAVKTQYSVGGIVGLSAGLPKSLDGFTYQYSSLDISATNCYLYMENCVNTGLIQNNATSSCGSAEYHGKIYTGGIAGTVLGIKENHAKIINCTNKGEVLPYTVNADPYYRAAVCGVCGGILGAGGNVDIEGGEVNAKIGSGKTHSFATAGVIGLALSKFSIKGLKVKADITRIAANDISPDDHALAVTNNTSKFKTDLSGSEISGCSFAGSFALSATASYDTRNADNTPVPPSEVVPVTETDIASGQKIVSASYTKGGITLKDNTFLTTAN